MNIFRLSLLSVAALAVSASVSFAAEVKAVHGLALHGAPKYAADFTHFDYTNPDAPKGGEMKLAAFGSFDTLNNFIIKGDPAPGLGMLYQSLMVNANDEAFSEYGEIAASVEVPADKSSVTFNLRPEAKFSDGKSLTAEDVVWTFDTLMKKGHPHYRSYYAHVKQAVAENPYRVKFVFDMAGNSELPMIMGQMPILPKHYWADKNFDATTLTAPVGSGAYKIKSVDPGRRIVYERIKDWWAENLPVNEGQNNFDTIVYDLYRDEIVLFQALFSGAYDFRAENIAKSWAQEYNGQKPVRDGLIKKEEIEHSMPTGMQSFAYNIRRPVFQDIAVRKALNYALDFAWSNKQFAFGSYQRSASYFENSELAARGLPSKRELEILEPFRGKVPDEVFTMEYKNPTTNGSGQDIRANLTEAKKILTEAGWVMGKNGVLEKNGVPLKFEILSYSDTFQRWVNPFLANLKKIGVQGNFRVIDSAQYQNRMNDFDYDMTIGSFPQSLSPGNEQLDFWGSSKADVKGSRNIVGIKNPVVYELIKLIISAPDREELIMRTRALDRVLLFNYYVIPQWYYNKHRIAYWNKFGHPAIAPKYALGVPETWWYDAEKAQAIAAKIPQEKKQ